MPCFSFYVLHIKPMKSLPSHETITRRTSNRCPRPQVHTDITRMKLWAHRPRPRKHAQVRISSWFHNVCDMWPSTGPHFFGHPLTSRSHSTHTHSASGCAVRQLQGLSLSWSIVLAPVLLATVMVMVTVNGWWCGRLLTVLPLLVDCLWNVSAVAGSLLCGWFLVFDTRRHQQAELGFNGPFTSS